MSRRDGGMVRELYEVRLIDVSPVFFPSYPKTRAKLWRTGPMGTLERKLELAELSLT
jgi:hypothetical protein